METKQKKFSGHKSQKKIKFGFILTKERFRHSTDLKQRAWKQSGSLGSIPRIGRLSTKGESFYVWPLMKHCSKWWMCSYSPPHFPQRGFCQPNLALTILLRDTKLFLIVFFSCHMPLPAIAHFWYWYLASLLLSNDVHVKAVHLSKLPMNELGEGMSQQQSVFENWKSRTPVQKA